MSYKKRRKRRPRKTQSEGARKIEEYLKAHNLSYKKEHRIKECRDKLPLPFDFVIFGPYALIEYNGIQHTKSVRRFGGKKALIKQQQHDLIKLEYCRANNIPFLVISHTEENIDELLDEFIRIIITQSEL